MTIKEFEKRLWNFRETAVQLGIIEGQELVRMIKTFEKDVDSFHLELSKAFIHVVRRADLIEHRLMQRILELRACLEQLNDEKAKQCLATDTAQAVLDKASPL